MLLEGGQQLEMLKMLKLIALKKVRNLPLHLREYENLQTL